jgi:NitT/TauT family transport system permease protein
MRSTSEAFLVHATQAGIVGAILLLWQLAAPLGWTGADMLPPFSDVLNVLWKEMHDRTFQSDVELTVVEIVVAFFAMVPAGLLLGFLIGESPVLYAVTRPLLQGFMAVPKAMFLPFFVMILGIGFVEKAVFAGVLGIFVVIINGIAAVHSIPQGLIVVARSMGATRAQLYLRIYLPGMLPLLLTGVRVGMIFTIFGVLLGEMYASTHGLGRSIFDAGEAFHFPQMLAGVFLVVFFSIVANEILRFFETASRRRRGLR